MQKKPKHSEPVRGTTFSWPARDENKPAVTAAAYEARVSTWLICRHREPAEAKVEED